MSKRNVIKILLVCAVLFAVGALSAVSVSAEISKVSDIPSHKVGVVGSFNDWKDDVPLTDDDGDGLYEGIVTVDEVTEDMIVGWSVDDEPTGESYLQFKVRLDGEWTDSWGYYEPMHDRCWNSQSNIPIKEAVVGEPLRFKVYFDTKNVHPAALENPDSYCEEPDPDWLSINYIYVYYKILPDPIKKASDISKHDVGVVGSFNGWKNDIPLTDDDSDGLYEGIVTVDEVTEDMIVGWNIDDEPTGESYLQFKVRLDGEWTDSWGYYEPMHDRCWNSQSNVPVKEAVVGKSLKFKVYFDIKNDSPAAMASPDYYNYGANGYMGDTWIYLNVYYEIISIGDLIVPNTSDRTEIYEFAVFLIVLSAGAIFFLKQRKFS